MAVTVSGLSETLADLRRVAEGMSTGGELENRLDDVLHDAVISGLKTKEASIPRDTGALRDSLLRKADRAHVWQSDGRGGYGLGSTLPPAEFQGHRIPQPDEAVVIKAVEDAIDRFLGEVLP